VATGGQLNREIMMMALAFPANNCPEITKAFA
jgi:hypothetical protein